MTPLASCSRIQPYSSEGSSLKDVLADKIPDMQTKVKEFRKNHGKTVVGQVTVDMVC